MRRFILIDHSIKGFGGHHYEYAVHVLNAAQDAGFKSILAVNRDFKAAKDHVNQPWDIVPAYEHGFWRIAPPRPTAQSTGWKSRLFDLRIRLKYGPLGRFLGTLPLFRGHYTPATIYQEYRDKPQLIPMLMGLILIKYPYGVIQAIHYLLRVIVSPMREYLIRIGLALLHLVIMLLYPFRLFKHVWLVKSLMSSRKVEANHEFGRDTGRLFDRIGFQPGDVVFIPTLSERDMLGLQEFLSNHPDAHMASWHLLFRRNLFDGPGPRELPALQGRPQTVSAFRQFHQNLNGNTIRFYTDTDRLSEEYNCLGLSRFHSLPIPINPDLTARAEGPDPASALRIVYAGDARVEKGYHYLPDLVRDLGINGHANDVVFQIQSNMAQGRVEDATAERLALQELEAIGPDRVRLIKAPLDSDQYFDLVSSADILLILYDAFNYYARSSGILVEALAAGIPVIVPADSWMGQQLADATYSYLAEVEETAAVVTRHVEACWSATPIPPKPAVTRRLKKQPEKAWKKKERKRASANPLKLGVSPGSATHLLLKYERPTFTGMEILVQIAQYTGDRRLSTSTRLLHTLGNHSECRALFELDPAADSIALLFNTMHGSTSCALTHLETILLRQGAEPLFTSEALFTDAVGRAYLPGDSVARHARELIEHYAHYRRTARDFAKLWNGRHSAHRLVRELMA